MIKSRYIPNKLLSNCYPIFSYLPYILPNGTCPLPDYTAQKGRSELHQPFQLRHGFLVLMNENFPHALMLQGLNLSRRRDYTAMRIFSIFLFSIQKKKLLHTNHATRLGALKIGAPSFVTYSSSQNGLHPRFVLVVPE